MADTSVFLYKQTIFIYTYFPFFTTNASPHSTALFFSSPLELFFPCAHFKMIFGDTQVDGAVKSQPRFG